MDGKWWEFPHTFPLIQGSFLVAVINAHFDIRCDPLHGRPSSTAGERNSGAPGGVVLSCVRGTSRNEGSLGIRYQHETQALNKLKAP